MTETTQDSGSAIDKITDWLGSFFRSAHDHGLKGTAVKEEYCAIEGTGFWHCMGTSKDNPVPHEVPLDFTRGVRPGEPVIK